MTEKNAEMARLLMAAEAVVEELDRQGLLEAVINLGFDPDQMAMAVIKAADRDVVPAKRSLPCSLGTGLLGPLGRRQDRGLSKGADET
jgi:hypothetical protein